MSGDLGACYYSDALSFVDKYFLQRMYKIDLHPYTWYQVRVTAHNEAGSTESILKFLTPPYNGGRSLTSHPSPWPSGGCKTKHSPKTHAQHGL